MGNTYYLAVDIGASSGRHMLAWMEDGQLKLEEMHRFSNGMKKIDGHLCWDLDGLFEEILTGLSKCREAGKQPSYMGIDTWGVDFVLLDENGERIGKPVGYRDSRTEGMDEKVYEIIDRDSLYERTGIQKQEFNTIYQLMAVKQREPQHLEQARYLLMIPDYLNYLLTGVMKSEYTEATTSQLIDPVTKDWDYQLIERLGYPRDMFLPVTPPGGRVGELKKEVRERVGFGCTVLLPATHDTGSAVLAVPTSEENVLYISSGTWSLIGTERKEADCSPESMAVNLTNEGGYDYRFRYLKNIMGLWMIQSVKKELKEGWKKDLSFGEICSLAAKEPIPSIVDCNDQCFLAPDSMIQAVRDYCLRSGQQVPQSIGEIASVIYNSLAVCYRQAAQEIEERTGICYDRIHIIGGGANAGYLNELTARYTKKSVYAGPTEATAIGNILVQMMTAGELQNLDEARNVVARSFPIEKYN